MQRNKLQGRVWYRGERCAGANPSGGARKFVLLETPRRFGSGFKNKNVPLQQMVLHLVLETARLYQRSWSRCFTKGLIDIETGGLVSLRE
jgi:hypothetical protein